MTRNSNFTLLALLLPMLALASDGKREQAYADLIERTLNMGEAVRLEALGSPFLAVYTETVSDNLGAVILLHDRGGYPDQRVLVHALRTQLPQHRWATLSLQAPVREDGAAEHDYYALFPEAKARIDAAVTFLRKAEVDHIVIVGYGLGALMALYGVNDNPKNIDGLVAISLPVPDATDERAQTTHFLEQSELPLLDIYAEHDLPPVVNSARKRKLAARENHAYRQDKVDAADHAYHYNVALLVKRVYGWLTRTFSQP